MTNEPLTSFSLSRSLQIIRRASHRPDNLATSHYVFANQLSKGLAAVRDGEKWGYLDKTDTMSTPPKSSEAYRFPGGLAPVKVGGNWGYMDKSGKMVIPPQYDVG